VEVKEINHDKSGPGSASPLKTFDIPSLIKKLKCEDAWRKNGKNSITLQKDSGIHIVLIALNAGIEIKAHQAPGPISVQVIEGHLEFYTENETVSLPEGKLLSLGKNIRHGLKASKESVLLLTMIIQESLR
jgi:quercetin dioxygenase-like cupin family protein